MKDVPQQGQTMLMGLASLGTATPFALEGQPRLSIDARYPRAPSNFRLTKVSLFEFPVYGGTRDREAMSEFVDGQQFFRVYVVHCRLRELASPAHTTRQKVYFLALLQRHLFYKNQLHTTQKCLKKN